MCKNSILEQTLPIDTRPNDKAHALGGCGVSTFACQSSPMRVELLKSAPLAKSRAAVVSARSMYSGLLLRECGDAMKLDTFGAVFS
jgi:hypothetical protein